MDETGSNPPRRTFDSLTDMNDRTKTTLSSRGFHEMTEIQSQTWDAVVRQKKDVVGLARTGTGKNLAFVLSSKEHILAINVEHSSTTIDGDNENKENNNQSIRVMIISPTCELAE